MTNKSVMTFFLSIKYLSVCPYHNAELLLHKLWRSKGFFKRWPNIELTPCQRHVHAGYLFPLHLNTYVMGLQPL